MRAGWRHRTPARSDSCEAIPQRERIERRLTQLWNYARYSTPSQVAGKYFFRRNDGLQNQAVLYMADQVDEPPRVLIDPNTWSDDGTVALASAEPDEQATYLAYTVSEAGSDWKTAACAGSGNRAATWTTS